MCIRYPAARRVLLYMHMHVFMAMRSSNNIIHMMHDVTVCTCIIIYRSCIACCIRTYSVYMYVYMYMYVLIIINCAIDQASACVSSIVYRIYFMMLYTIRLYLLFVIAYTYYIHAHTRHTHMLCTAIHVYVQLYK